MLVSAFATSGVETVQAYEPPGGWPPGQPYFTLHATETHNPDWGYYGGYHPIWAAIQNELAQIGINLVLNTYDEWAWWDRVWDTGWNLSWDEGGWDMFISEWWMMPTGLFGMEPLVYSWFTPWPEPRGVNIFPWLDETADELLWKGMHALNASERKFYLWAWQEWFMHNPPMANMYYPRLYEIIAAYLEGWDPIVRFRDISHLTLNNTMLAEARPDRDNKTLIYAVVEPLWGMNPLFIDTYTDQWMGDLRFETLYDLSIDPWPPTGQEPPPTDFYSKPVLAAAPPIFMEGPNGPNTRARIPLRPNVTWSNGFPFNATDVKFTFDLVLNPVAKAVARGKLSRVVESVEIVNETYVDFILYAPNYADFAALLSDDRGLAIIPYHFLKDILPGNLKSHASNTWFSNPQYFIPGTGPFKLQNSSTAVDPDYHIIFEKNSYYFGYDLGWGPYNIDTLRLEWIKDPASRLVAQLDNDIDIGDYPTAPVQVFKDLQECMCMPYLMIMQYDHPASNPVMFNLNNQYLSNRYVRQAICHAIPYAYIIEQILPSWGIETAYRGKTLITPLHYYTDPNNVTKWLFNVDLYPYEYDITKAQKYMDMWYYSQESADYTKGPVGDADFSGFADLDDFYIWTENFGTTPAEWTFLPGQDVDPDWDNTGYVELNDYYEWPKHWSFHYPEASTTHVWSR